MDVGCGKGYGTYYLAKHAATAEGFDFNPESIDIACANFKKPNLSYHVGDALEGEGEKRTPKSGDEVHRDEPAATHLVLDPRPEEPERDHVEDEVAPARVREHVRHERPWHRADERPMRVEREEPVQLRYEIGAHDEHDDVRRDEPLHPRGQK